MKAARETIGGGLSLFVMQVFWTSLFASAEGLYGRKKTRKTISRDHRQASPVAL
jgi:hypothetical protein